MDDETLARFLAKVEKRTEVTSPYVDTPCWLWTAGTTRDGYGRFRTVRVLRAHRLAHEHWNGPIPNGLCVLHRCDTPPCVRPDHLFTGTQVENIADMTTKGRARGSSGGTHWNAKLTAGDVREIRRRYAVGEITQRALARDFGVSKSQIGRILNHEKWAVE